MKWNVLGIAICFFLFIAAIIAYWLSPGTDYADWLVTGMLAFSAFVVAIKFLKLKV